MAFTLSNFAFFLVVYFITVCVDSYTNKRLQFNRYRLAAPHGVYASESSASSPTTNRSKRFRKRRNIRVLSNDLDEYSSYINQNIDSKAIESQSSNHTTVYEFNEEEGDERVSFPSDTAEKDYLFDFNGMKPTGHGKTLIL